MQRSDIFKGQVGTAWPLTMGPIGCLKAVVTDYQSTLRNNSEERNLIYATAEAWSHMQCFTCYVL